MSGRSILASGPEAIGTSWWSALLLGAVLVLSGLFVLANLTLATAISAFLFGIVLLVAGASEILQAFSAQHWHGFFLRLLIGALYGVGGVMLVMDPLGASVFMTLVFAVALIASGVVRLFQAYQYWEWYGWLLVLSGIVGIVAGLVILSQWPISGIWVLGMLIGVDLLLHGIWWITLGLHLRQEPGAS